MHDSNDWCTAIMGASFSSVEPEFPAYYDNTILRDSKALPVTLQIITDDFSFGDMYMLVNDATF